METEFQMPDTRARGCQICLDPDALVEGEAYGHPACGECCGTDQHGAVTAPERSASVRPAASAIAASAQ